MNVVYGLNNLQPIEQPTVVAVGTFDGIHTGHQVLLARVTRQAQRRGALATIVTFEPYPVEVLAPERAPGRLTTLDEKLQFVEKLEIALCVVIEFTPAFARTSDADFVRDILVQRLRAEHIVVGSTHTFGADRHGDSTRLVELGRQYGFTVERVPPAQVNGSRVSSTLIREAIRRGECPWAAALLGRVYSIKGDVVRGRGMGAKLGFPTANLQVDPHKVLPADGVYAVYADVAGGRREGVISIGVRPTFPEAGRAAEVHLLDFDGDLHGQTIRVHFIERVRGEMKFASPEALAQQIGRDVEVARRILATMSPAIGESVTPAVARNRSVSQ